MFNDLTNALEWLYEQKKLHKREDLSRITKCIELLNICPNYKIVHIAGTNGKGSTASYIKKMLMLKGFKVGFFVSPYVISFNERIQINDDYIQDAEILDIINRLYEFQNDYYAEYNDIIPFFELTFLMALLYFAKNSIDYAIIECGIGGLLDATNVLDSDIAVITNIGYDHMQQLGSTLEEIAYHKLGITKPNKPCFTAVDNYLKEYFENYAEINKVDLRIITDKVSNIVEDTNLLFSYEDERYETILKASYQAYNAALAISVIRYIDNNYPKKLIDKALMEVSWPGRYEYIAKNIIIDGAHNIHGIDALVNSLKKYNCKIKIVFTALHDKSIQEMIASLDKVASKYYFTTINDKRATNSNEFINYTTKDYEVFADYKEALTKAQKELKADEILVVTGSLHFISEVRKYLLKE